MLNRIAKRTIYILVTIMLGAVAGAVCWVFFFLMNNGIALVWDTLPNAVCPGQVWWPLAVCLVGGLVVGLFQKRFPGQPREMDEVMAEVKATGRYEYGNMGVGFVGALIPLLFGGSLGPEAGLTGVIAGLCTWVGDRLKFLGKEFRELSSVGIAAVLTATFDAPLFGLAVPVFGSAEGPVEDEPVLAPKPLKMAVYLIAIASAVGTMMGLGYLLGGMGGLPRFSGISMGGFELALLVPCALAGACVGWLYHAAGALAGRTSSAMGDRPIVKALVAGLFLGCLGMVLPYTMFAGEIQAEELQTTWTTIGAVALIATALLKPFTLQFCLKLGWRGGAFFPVIFCGVSLGYGIALITGANPVFCLCACTAGALGMMMRQPLMAVLLLFMCFPVKGVFVMLIAAVIGSAIPVPAGWVAKKERKAKGLKAKGSKTKASDTPDMLEG
ncbi:chloride channel protein [Adlercreutzia sp. ZJ141]|uniref:chloride channel protein n=1 Tax=Adlercreutzia sp. ZJ141 TaxID=2709406 RepID=UPI0013E9F7C8|nr:chloride channel protein [Adlercreutzia sp. ZJ141]